MSNHKTVNAKDTEFTTDETKIPEEYETIKVEKDNETSAETPQRGDYVKIGRTWPDIAFPFIDKISGNIYIFIAVLFYCVAIVTGHLRNKEDFFWTTLSIVVSSLIISLYNFFKKK